MKIHTVRRVGVVGVIFLVIAVWLVVNPAHWKPNVAEAEVPEGAILATVVLAKLKVAEQYSKEKYVRSEFYTNWPNIDGCDARNVILRRDLSDVVLDGCIVKSGTLLDPYTGNTISFVRGTGTSSAVQIDHVVALSNAWKTGAEALGKPQRKALASDPLNLLAVDGPTNQAKSDKDASEWLPPNAGFRCQYVARQVSVKYKYVLWVTLLEKSAMERILSGCPNEVAVGVEE